MIVYETKLKEMPKSCAECKFEICNLPFKNNGYEIRAKYMKKRHENCPLSEIK